MKDVIWGSIVDGGAHVGGDLDFFLDAEGEPGSRRGTPIALTYALVSAGDLDTRRAAALAAGSRFLIAPVRSFLAGEDYFTAAERIYGRRGVFFVWDPDQAWSRPFASFYLENGFVLSPHRWQAQLGVADYYLRQGFRTSLLAFSSADREILIGIPGGACTDEAILASLRDGGCFLTTRRDLVVHFAVGGQGPGATVPAAPMSALRIAADVSGVRAGEVVQVLRNGIHVVGSASLSDGHSLVSVDDTVWGSSFYYLKVVDETGALVALSNPVYVKAAGLLKGDHHTHYVNPPMLATRRFDYVVFGEYTVWGGEWSEEQARSLGLIRVPGGELHGSGAKGEPWDPHVLILQRDPQKRYQDHMGFHRTLAEARKNNDLAFLAHPRIFSTKILPHGSPRPGEPEYDPGFNGLEIVNTAPKNIMRLGIEHGVSFAADAVDHLEAESMWDECLMRGQRVTGIANSDCHGVWRDGMHANNLRLGTNPTVVILKKEPSIDSILEALEAGSCWFTTGDCEFLEVTLGGKLMGEVCLSRGQVEVRVLCESHTPIASLEVVAGGIAHTTVRFEPVSRLTWRAELEITGAERFVRVRLGDQAGGVTYSNPVYTQVPRLRGQ